VLAVQLLRQSVSGFSSQRTRFVSTTIHIELAVEKLHLERFFLSNQGSSPVNQHYTNAHLFTHHLRASSVDGRIILRWIFRKWDVGTWTGSSWLRIGTGGGNL